MKMLAKKSGVESGQVFIDLKEEGKVFSQKIEWFIIPSGVYNIRFRKNAKLSKKERQHMDAIEREKQMMRNVQHARRRQNLAMLPERLVNLE